MVSVISSIVITAATAVVLGGAFGLGVCLLFAVAPRWGAVSLTRRIAPYIRDVTDPQGLSLDLGAPIRDIRDVWQRLQRWLTRVLGGSTSIERRLQKAGWSIDVVAFRGRQLAWGITGLALGGVVVVVLLLMGRGNTAAALIPPVFAVIAAALYDMRLSAATHVRVARLHEELPTVLEFVALCLSAGEGIYDSLRRVSEVAGGELTAELRHVVLAVGTGSALSDELTRMADRVDVAALSRSIDQLVAAIDRGAPLSHVLHAQALDAREDTKRVLIERAGRKEIYMLIPLVFLVLPLSVLFAVFPGIFILRLGVG